MAEVKKINNLAWNNEDLKTFNSTNERLIDTKGFTPIEVRMQRLLESGYIAQFNTSEFDSVEEKELYLSDDYRIDPNMDLEEIQEVLYARNVRKLELIQEHQKKQAENEKSDNDLNEKPVDNSFQKDDTKSESK